jgi:hypothetical protein
MRATLNLLEALEMSTEDSLLACLCSAQETVQGKGLVEAGASLIAVKWRTAALYRELPCIFIID